MLDVVFIHTKVIYEAWCLNFLCDRVRSKIFLGRAKKSSAEGVLFNVRKRNEMK